MGLIMSKNIARVFKSGMALLYIVTTARGKFIGMGRTLEYTYNAKTGIFEAGCMTYSNMFKVILED